MGISSSNTKIGRWLEKIGVVGCKDPEKAGVKSFKADQQKELAFTSQDRGIRQIPLERIVGSVGRYQDFDRHFRMKNYLPPERLERIKKAMREGKRMPPVKLYQIKKEFYVLDGNHRIAAARELGRQEIRAHIQEFIPSKETLENLLYRQKAEFEDITGLRADIELTEIGQYEPLVNQIEHHRIHLAQERGGQIALNAAADDWYRTIYLPMIGLIEQSGLAQAFPLRTLSDLYAYISFHQWDSRRQRTYGAGIDEFVPPDMEDFRAKMATKKEGQYPEMMRGITVFILMKVQAKREHRIIERLVELQEIREIHSVHGEIDLLVKAVLTRDILSSDAEVISQFVHDKVRQIPGVHSTQTLIPGFSKIKNENGRTDSARDD